MTRVPVTRNLFDLTGLLERITAAISLPGEDPETRLRKATLALASLMFVPAGALWGLLYIGLGEPRSGVIPLGYALVSTASLVYLRATRRYEQFRTSQLVLVLVLPALLMASLGGYVPSSVVIVWSFLCPLGALLFAGRRRAWRWLLLYLALLAVSGLLDRGLHAPATLPEHVIVLLFVLNLGTVSTIVFTMLAYFDSERDRIHTLLQQEKEKSERLLLNVLPEEVAPALKEGRPTARRFESASILFADIVGFTSLSTKLSAEALVDLLNEVFSSFDSMVEAYGVEKIRTIGDNYMVASGVPIPRPDHAKALANMALDMCSYLRARSWSGEVKLEFRLGMNSGPLVGAVIGQTKFHYDVWGDAVNMASRMESHGLPGMIQLAPQAYALLKDDFVCERRGVIDIKGAGPVETWFLLGRRGVEV
jgi:guanylate cyclase